MGDGEDGGPAPSSRGTYRIAREEICWSNGGSAAAKRHLQASAATGGLDERPGASLVVCDNLKYIL